MLSYERENCEKWLSKLYDKLDYTSRNSITLLRYKLKYHEELTIVEVFLLISLFVGYMNL